MNKYLHLLFVKPIYSPHVIAKTSYQNNRDLFKELTFPNKYLFGHTSEIRFSGGMCNTLQKIVISYIFFKK